MGKDTYIYLKDDDALAEFTKNNQGKKYTVSRFKGLGEMNDEETELLVDKEQRTLCQVTVNDIPQTDLLFEHLMGTAVVPRKKFIQQYSKEATYQI